MAQALIPDGAIAPEYPATACGEAVPMPTAEVPGVPVDAFTQNIEGDIALSIDFYQSYRLWFLSQKRWLGCAMVYE